jgi:hypothetical protein
MFHLNSLNTAEVFLIVNILDRVRADIRTYPLWNDCGAMAESLTPSSGSEVSMLLPGVIL